MTGQITTTVDDTGIGTSVSLSHVSGLDKVLLLNAFANGLDMDDKELQQALLVLPLARGLINANEEADKDE